jgi:hypothetical protein
MRNHLVALSVAMLLATVLVVPAAQAACVPASGSAPPGTVVTCSGTTTNQDAPNGFGTGAQSGLTVNVVPGAIVNATNIGISVGDNSTVNNFGTIFGQTGIQTGTNSTITDTGPINANSATQNALAIFLNGNGNITNSGAMTANSTGGVAFAITVNGNGNITNSGAVAATSTTNGDAVGLFVVGNGNITNSGAVTASSISGGAFPIDINGNGNITNSGAVVATTTTGVAQAIFLGGDGNITNSGALVATSSTNFVNAILLVGNGNITNSGAVVATSSTSFVQAIALGGNGNITNSATVTATSSTNFAQAIILAGDGSITNSGALTTTAAGPFSDAIVLGGSGAITNSAALTATNSGGRAEGILVFGNANIANSGPITVRTNDDDLAGGARAINVNGNANVTNSAALTATNGTGTAIGIIVFGNGSIVNSGPITANAGGSPVSGIASALNLAGTGTIINTATVQASAPSSGLVFTISTNGDNSTVINSGTVAAFGGGAGSAAIALTGQFDTLTLLPGTRIIGPMALGTSNTVNLFTGQDIPWVWTFSAFSGAPNVLFGTTVHVFGGAPFVITGNQVATIDPTIYGMTDRALMDFTGGISSMIRGRFAGMANAGAYANAFAPAGPAGDVANAAFGSIPSLSVAYAPEASGLPLKAASRIDAAFSTVVWSSAFAGYRVQPGDAATVRATNLAEGGAIGIERLVNPDLKLGAFVGGGFGRLALASLSQGADTDYAFAGAYGRYEWAAQFADFALYGGNARTRTNRLIADNLAANGLDTAVASYNGWFISPEAAYGLRISAGNGLVLTPAARIRYVAGLFDGYGESGSAQMLSVGSRTVQDVEERLELTLSSTQVVGARDLFKASLQGGVLGLQRLGDTSVSTVLLGQNLAFLAPGKSSVVGPFAAAGFDYRFHDQVSFFGAVEGTWTTDRAGTVTGRAGMRVAY